MTDKLLEIALARVAELEKDAESVKAALSNIAKAERRVRFEAHERTHESPLHQRNAVYKAKELLYAAIADLTKAIK